MNALNLVIFLSTGEVQCRMFRAELIALVFLEIGQRYFAFDNEKACFDVKFCGEVNPMPLLLNLLDAVTTSGGLDAENQGICGEDQRKSGRKQR